MSILTTFKKLVDPETARLEEELAKKLREEKEQDEAGDPPGYVCKICGHEGEEREFCPKCLAPTMKRR